MDTQLAAVAQGLIDSIANADDLTGHIDSTEASPHEVAPNTQQFTMVRNIDRRSDGKPLGRMVYTVTVTGQFEAFDDE